jgi:hypothetical protein
MLGLTRPVESTVERHQDKLALLPLYWFGWKLGHLVGEVVGPLGDTRPDLRATEPLAVTVPTPGQPSVAAVGLSTTRPVRQPAERSLLQSYRCIKELPITKRLLAALVGSATRSELLLIAFGLGLVLLGEESLTAETVLPLLADILLLLAELLLGPRCRRRPRRSRHVRPAHSPSRAVGGMIDHCLLRSLPRRPHCSRSTRGLLP